MRAVVTVLVHIFAGVSCGSYDLDYPPTLGWGGNQAAAKASAPSSSSPSNAKASYSPPVLIDPSRLDLDEYPIYTLPGNSNPRYDTLSNSNPSYSSPSSSNPSYNNAAEVDEYPDFLAKITYNAKNKTVTVYAPKTNEQDKNGKTIDPFFGIEAITRTDPRLPILSKIPMFKKYYSFSVPYKRK